MLRTVVFTSGILFKDGKILILKRRDDDTHAGKWDCVGGFFKEFESGEECMLREAKEELGIDVEIVKNGKVFEMLERDRRCIVLPYLLSADSPAIKLTEYVEYKWVAPDELKKFNCVPDLIEASKLFGLLK